MASPSVTYNFVNGTVADGDQVDTNFQDLINAMTDGSKSFSIDALTVAGAAIFNGAVTLGNATGDDVVVTGYLASNLISKTTNTYALGSSTILYSAVYATRILAGDGTAAAPAYSFNSSGNGDNGMYLSADNAISFATAGTQRAVITATGKLGIGVASPDGKLDVRTTDDTNDRALYVEKNHAKSGTTYGGIISAQGASTTNIGIYVEASGATNNYGLVVGSGYSGFGTTSPLAPLHVVSNLNGGVLSRFCNSGNSNPYGMVIQFPNAAPDNNTSYFLDCEDNTAVRCVIYSDGDLQNHDNSYGAISDERLKQDIIDASSQIDDIKALKIRKYRFKTDVAANPDCCQHIGVIAQELMQTSPGLVTHNTDTDTYAVQYSILYMKAVKALQETILKVEELSAKLDTALAEIEELKAR